MNLSEFQAWFEGHTEEMKGPPTKAQWAKIKLKVAEIAEEPTLAPIFVDQYVRPWRRYWDRKDYCLWAGTKLSPLPMPRRLDFVSAGRAEYLSTRHQKGS